MYFSKALLKKLCLMTLVISSVVSMTACGNNDTVNTVTTEVGKNLENTLDNNNTEDNSYTADNDDTENNEDTDNTDMTGIETDIPGFIPVEHPTDAEGHILSTERVSFPGAAFIGDSRVVGLESYGVISDADVYASVGISIKDVMNKKTYTNEDGTLSTIMEAMFKKEYDKIYIKFGINELGWVYLDEYKRYYGEVIDSLKNRYPNARIYLQATLPMLEGRTDDTYNNTKIDKINELTKQLAQEKNVNWVDITSAVTDSTGVLPEEASNDGIHLTRDYLFKWVDYLKAMTY